MTLDQDYEALRAGAGARLVPRDVLVVRGPDAESYLQGQLSQDVAALATGASTDSLVLSPQGKLDALVRVTRRASDDFLIDVDGGWGPPVRARLERFKLRVRADIAAVPMSCLSLRGPAAAAVDRAASPVGVEDDGVSIAFSWGGIQGVDVLGPAVGEETLAALGPAVRRCGSAAWEARRVEAGVPVMGAELDERTIAAEAGLVERTVSFTKGCYTGQELVARLDARGSNVARRLVGLVMAKGAPAVVPEGRGSEEAAPPVPTGTEIFASGDERVGAVTSSAWSPALEAAVALAYLHRRVEAPGPVSLRLADGTVLAADARPLPLAGDGTIQS